jgi:uncharacterized membrane protein YwzB
MNKETIILITAWILMIISLVLFIPKNKFREAQVIFFFKQLMTWVLGLTVAQFRLIEYPVREFSYATKSSFSFEYFIYPSICVVFNLHYPEGKSRIRQFMHYVYFCTGMTILEVLCEEYTNILKYIHWHWYTTWITLFVTFFLSHLYYVWFFRLRSK